VKHPTTVIPTLLPTRYRCPLQPDRKSQNGDRQSKLIAFGYSKRIRLITAWSQRRNRAGQQVSTLLPDRIKVMTGFGVSGRPRTFQTLGLCSIRLGKDSLPLSRSSELLESASEELLFVTLRNPLLPSAEILMKQLEQRRALYLNAQGRSCRRVRLPIVVKLLNCSPV
jgi:hypothetical protein